MPFSKVNCFASSSVKSAIIIDCSASPDEFSQVSVTSSSYSAITILYVYCESAIIIYCFVLFTSVVLSYALAFVCGIQLPDIVIEKAVNKARIFLNLLFPISLSSFCLLLEILK